MTYLLIPLFAVLNRARGSQLFGLTSSTTVGRLVASFGMALGIALCGYSWLLLPVAWGGLYGWMVPAWDSFWSAEIGHDPLHSKLWGLWHMALRMTLAMPVLLAVAYLTGGSYWYALGVPFLALPYLIFGLLSGKITALADPIPASEYAAGGILGLLFSGLFPPLHIVSYLL